MTDDQDPIARQLGAYGDALERHLANGSIGPDLPEPTPLTSKRPPSRTPVLLGVAASVIVFVMIAALVVRSRGADQDVASGTKGDAMSIVFKSADATRNAETFHFSSKHTIRGGPNDSACTSSASTDREEVGGVDNRSHVMWQGQSGAPTAIAAGAKPPEASLYVARSSLPADWPVEKAWVKATSADMHATMTLLSGGKEPSPNMSLNPEEAEADPRKTLEEVKKVASSVTEVGSEQVRGVPATRYRVTIDQQKVMAEMNVSTGGPVPGSMPPPMVEGPASTVDVWVDGESLVRRIEDRSEFQGTVITSWTEFYDYGTSDVATVPSAADVADVGDLPASLFGPGVLFAPPTDCFPHPPGMSDEELQRMKDSMKANAECQAEEFRKETEGKTWRQYRAEHPDRYPDLNAQEGPGAVVAMPASTSCGGMPLPAIPANGGAGGGVGMACPSVEPGQPASPATAVTPTTVISPPDASGAPAVSAAPPVPAVQSACPSPIDDEKMKACMDAMSKQAPAPPSPGSSGSEPAPAVAVAPAELPKECEGLPVIVGRGVPCNAVVPAAPVAGGAPATDPNTCPSPLDPDDPKLQACLAAIEKQQPATSGPVTPQTFPNPPECDGVIGAAPCPPSGPDGVTSEPCAYAGGASCPPAPNGSEPGPCVALPPSAGAVPIPVPPEPPMPAGSSSAGGSGGASTGAPRESGSGG